MSEDNNKTLEDHAQTVRKKHHDLTLKGDADETGIIATNAKKNENVLLSEKKKEKDDLQMRLLLDLLDDHIQHLQEDIQRIKLRIEALEKIKELLSADKFDPTSPEHLLLLQSAQITPDQANIENVDQGLSDLRIQLSEKEQDLLDVQQIREEALNNANSALLVSIVRQLELTENGKTQRDLTANSVDTATAKIMDAAIGMTEDEQALLANMRQGRDKLISQDKISFAETITENPIQAPDVKAAFVNAHDGLNSNAITEINVDIDLTQAPKP